MLHVVSMCSVENCGMLPAVPSNKTPACLFNLTKTPWKWEWVPYEWNRSKKAAFVFFPGLTLVWCSEGIFPNHPLRLHLETCVCAHSALAAPSIVWGMFCLLWTQLPRVVRVSEHREPTHKWSMEWDSSSCYILRMKNVKREASKMRTHLWMWSLVAWACLFSQVIFNLRCHFATVPTMIHILNRQLNHH